MHFPIEAIPADAEFAGMAVTHTVLPRGFNLDALLAGLPNNLCPCPHWGYILAGRIVAKYEDGSEEVFRAGEVYYLPPGHTAVVEEDCASIEFSPVGPFRELLQHMAARAQAS